MASPLGEKEDQATDAEIEKVENLEENDNDGMGHGLLCHEGNRAVSLSIGSLVAQFLLT